MWLTSKNRVGDVTDLNNCLQVLRVRETRNRGHNRIGFGGKAIKNKKKGEKRRLVAWEWALSGVNAGGPSSYHSPG
jgi:hypothetical protein